MIPLHALTLILMGRFSSRLYTAYSSWYAIGTLASMQVPFVGFQPVRTSEHMAALGTSRKDRRSVMQLTFGVRCIRPAADRCFRRTGPGPCVVQAVPKHSVWLRHRHRAPWRGCLRRPHVQGMDCTLDRPFLLPLGHGLREEV